MLDIEQIPFSYFGSYFVLSYSATEGLYIRDIRNGDTDTGRIFRLYPCYTGGREISYYCVTQPHLLQILAKHNDSLLLQCCFADENTLLISTEEHTQVYLELLGQKYDHINPLGETVYELHSYSQEVKMLLCVRQGKVTAELPWDRIGNSFATLLLDGATELSIESYLVIPQKKVQPSFAQCMVRTKQLYIDFYKKLPTITGDLQTIANKSYYILFSCIVQPEGILKKYAVYMSNNYMTNIWSWDHAFTSLAMCAQMPEMAYEQFMYFQEYQDKSGVFPDFVNNKYASFSCCKPPVHGFIYQILMRENPYFSDHGRLLSVYQMLKLQAGYWEQYRKHGELYFYNHGNDSGWDNATMFAQGCPIITPDLAAHLITLHDALADIATRLYENESQTKKHRDKAYEIAEHLVTTLWNGNYFVAQKFNGQTVDAPHCLLRLIPLVAAKYLPAPIVHTMREELNDPRQFTEFGFATERTDSPFYEANGYWRGPIWAPTSLLLIEALIRCNELTLARTAAERFCQLCLLGGLAENFNAKTGQGLEDPAFSWTSSVFLYLAEKLQTEFFSSSRTQKISLQ